MSNKASEPHKSHHIMGSPRTCMYCGHLYSSLQIQKPCKAAPAFPDPTPTGECDTDIPWSGICNRGTKGCCKEHPTPAPQEQDAREWLLSGGGGFEGSLEATTFSAVGLIDMLKAYGEYKDELHKQPTPTGEQEWQRKGLVIYQGAHLIGVAGNETAAENFKVKHNAALAAAPTGEPWTKETVREICRGAHGIEQEWQRCADAHNAALAATQTNPKLQAQVERDKRPLEEVTLLQRVRSCMKRWAARYAASPHAKEHVKETRLLIEELEGVLLKE